MPRKRRIRMMAGFLMLLSGVTHVSQLGVYGLERSAVVAATFGVAYFGIGLALLGPGRAALWLGAILPGIGGTLGVYRFFFWQANPFSVFHVIIDLIVVPFCAYLLVAAGRRERQDSTE